MFCQLGHTFRFVCLSCCFLLPEIELLSSLATLKAASSLRCICSPSHPLVSVRTKLQQQHKQQHWPASKPTAHLQYKSPQCSAFFSLSVVLQLFYLCLSTFVSCFILFFFSVSAPLAHLTSITVYLLSASCLYVVLLFNAFAALWCSL